MHVPGSPIVRDPEDPGDLGRIEVGGVRVMRSRFTPLTRLGTHAHACACLTVVVKGNVVKSFARSTLEVDSPHAVAMPPEEPHRARFGSAGAEVVMVEPMHDLERLLGENMRLFGRVQPIRDPAVSALAWQLRRELSQPDAVTPLAVTGLVLELLAHAARRDPARRVRPAWIAAAEEYLRAHFADRVGLDEVAVATGQSPGRVSRGFRSHLGVSPWEYVRRLRIDWAVHQLSTTDRPLSEIALDAGFADQSHFTRAFKRRIGASPGAFRRDARGARETRT